MFDAASPYWAWSWPPPTGWHPGLLLTGPHSPRSCLMPSTGVVTLLPSCLAPSLGWWDGPWMVKTYPATSEDTPHTFLASSHQRGPKWHFLSSQRWDYARSEVRAILLHLPVPATKGVTWSAVLHWQMLCGEEVAMAGVRDVRSICTSTCCVSWQERKKTLYLNVYSCSLSVLQGWPASILHKWGPPSGLVLA